MRTIADFQKTAELQQLIRILAARIGNKLDHTKLAAIVGVSRPTIQQYLEFLEKTYLICRVPAYSASPERAAALGKKLYFYDNGIANTLARLSEGAIFENAVFNQLRAYGELAYLGRGNDYEVDFILRRGAASGAVDTALEVKIHPLPTDQQKLQRIIAAYPIQAAHLVGRFPAPGFKAFVWGGLIL